MERKWKGAEKRRERDRTCEGTELGEERSRSVLGVCITVCVVLFVSSAAVMCTVVFWGVRRRIVLLCELMVFVVL